MSYVYRSFEAADRVAYLNGSPTRTAVAELIQEHAENAPHIYPDGSTS